MEEWNSMVGQSGNNCWTAVLHIIIVVNPLGLLYHTCPFLCPEKVGELGGSLLLQMQACVQDIKAW